MIGPDAPRDDLAGLLRDHGGLEGLARELGQLDPAGLYEPAANENEPRERVGLWRWLWALGSNLTKAPKPGLPPQAPRSR